MGYFHADDSRVDVLLSVEGSSVTLRREPEIVRGVQCLVVDGASTSGRYTLWLDPKRGHNLVRAEAEKKQGDVVFGRKLDKGSRVLHVVDVLRIEKVDGEWVPVETEEQVTRVFPQSPTPAQRGHLRHKHTSVQLRPDFDAVRAFEPDDVRDGTLVYSGGKRSVWRSGKLEPLAF